MNIQGLFPLVMTGLILQFKGLSSPLHHYLKVSILLCLAFFMVQLSHLYMTTLASRTGISTQKLLKKQLLDEKMNKPGIMKAWLELGVCLFVC